MLATRLPEHLYGFQRVDAARLAEHGNHILLEPMGAGKSVMAIAAAEARDAFTIVVICPAILREDWRAKFTKFGRNNYGFKADQPGRRVLVYSYESLNTPERRDKLLQALLPTGRIDVLILDEAQRLKNPEARIVSSVYGGGADGTGLIALARVVWIVSGTLVVNDWSELYTHIRACFPDRLPQVHGQPLTFFQFLDEFCVWEATTWGFKVLRNKSPERLRALLQGIAIYRGAEEINKLLPPLTVTQVTLPRSTINDAAYQEFEEGKPAAALRAQIEDPEGDWEDTPSLSAARHALADMKAPAVATYVRHLLMDDARCNVLVFGWHRSAMAQIGAELAEFGGADVIDGDMPEAMRNALIDSFQRKHRRLLVLGIGTAREGITLTAANRVVFAEAAWTPAYNSQAIHRAQRIGQTRPVIAEFLTVADTLDEAVSRVCMRKTLMLAEVLNLEQA